MKYKNNQTCNDAYVPTAANGCSRSTVMVRESKTSRGLASGQA
jgi:hypothetical protein